MQTRQMLVSTLALAVVCAAVLAVVLLRETPDVPDPLEAARPERSAEARVAAADSTPSEADTTEVPLAELDNRMEALAQKALYGMDSSLEAQRTKLLQFKAEGGTMWGSENWMKSREYYAALDTPELAEECFERSTFFNEMMIFDDPRFSYMRLSVMHEGFAELFAREDLWKGLVRAFEYCASRLNPESDLEAIIIASMTLDSLSSKALRVPELQEAIKGHEEAFYEASYAALRSYRDYSVEFDPERVGTRMPFFGEGHSVALSTLDFLERVDPQQYKTVAPKIRAFRFGEEQNMEEMKEFLELAVEAFDSRR